MTRTKRLLLIAMAVAGLATGELHAQQEILMDFDSPGAGLPSEWEAGLSTFTNHYREDGMLLQDGVIPQDPRLNSVRYAHFHMSYADPSIVFCNCTIGNCTLPGLIRCPVGISVGTPGRLPGGSFVPLTVEEAGLEPRVIKTHDLQQTMQLTYDPDEDGVPNLFNLISIDVLGGRMNVGTQSRNGSISVYNNLTGGFRWFLIDANNLNRATLELPRRSDSFSIDNIVFQPVGGPVMTGGALTVTPVDVDIAQEPTEGIARPVVLEDPEPVNFPESLHDLLHSVAPAIAGLDVGRSLVRLRADGPDRWRAFGTVFLARDSNGVDIPNEDITVSLEGFTQTIPAGAFLPVGDQTFQFQGSPGGIRTMELRVLDGHPRHLRFSLEASRVNLTGIDLAQPVSVSLQIGDDQGISEILFDENGRGASPGLGVPAPE